MRTSAFRLLCRLLIASMMLMSFSYARATMIGVDQLASASPGSAAERAALIETVSRAEVAQQLQALGIEPRAAIDRVQSMTDDEVRALAGEVQSLPAGASSSSGWWIAAVVVVALIVWYMYK